MGKQTHCLLIQHTAHRRCEICFPLQELTCRMGKQTHCLLIKHTAHRRCEICFPLSRERISEVSSELEPRNPLRLETAMKTSDSQPRTSAAHIDRAWHEIRTYARYSRKRLEDWMVYTISRGLVSPRFRRPGKTAIPQVVIAEISAMKRWIYRYVP